MKINLIQKKNEFCKQQYYAKKTKMSSFLLKNIAQEIERSVSEFADRISEKYNIPKEDILVLWSENATTSTSSTTAVPKTVPKTVRKRAPISAPVEKQKEPVEALYCPYRYARKPRAGQVCGAKARAGGTHCSKHKGYENKEVVTKRLLPKPRQPTEQKETEYMMRMNSKLGRFWHPETRLVFRRKGDITVIGHATDDDQIEDLTEAHIEIVKRWGFKYENNSEEENTGNTGNTTPKKRVLSRKSPEKKAEDSDSGSVDNDAENTENTENSSSTGDIDQRGGSANISELQTLEQDIEEVLHEILEDPKKGSPENLVVLFDEEDYSDDEAEEND